MGAAYTQIQNGTIQADEKFVESIHTMIGNSDNEVANQILNQIGGIEYVNQYIKENGYEETILGDQFEMEVPRRCQTVESFWKAFTRNAKKKQGIVSLKIYRTK